jgi:hypothetical protein
MSVQTFFTKIEAAAVSLLKDGDADVAKIFAEVEPAVVSFAKTISHDFMVAFMPEALQAVANTLASGTALTTATISGLASDLEQKALTTGKTVFAQDALATVMAAAAHIQQAAASITPAKPAT